MFFTNSSNLFSLTASTSSGFHEEEHAVSSIKGKTIQEHAG